MFIKIIKLISIISLASCATMYEAPQRIDPLKDLFGNVPIIKSETSTLTDAKSKVVAIILSTSSGLQIKQKKEADDRTVNYAKNQLPAAYQRVNEVVNAVSPDVVLREVSSTLASKFKDVIVINDFSEFQESKYQAALVLDIGLGGKYSSSIILNDKGTFQTDLTLFIFDNKLKLIGKANGIGIGGAERGNGDDLIAFVSGASTADRFFNNIKPIYLAERESRNQALRKLLDSLEIYLKK